MAKDLAFINRLKSTLEAWEKKQLIDANTRQALENDINQNISTQQYHRKSWLSFRICMLLLAGLFVTLLFFNFFFSDIYNWIDQHILGHSDGARSAALLVIAVVFYYFSMKNNCRGIVYELISLLSALFLAGGLALLITSYLPSTKIFPSLEGELEGINNLFLIYFSVAFGFSYISILHQKTIAYTLLFIVSAIGVWQSAILHIHFKYASVLIPLTLGCIIHLLAIAIHHMKHRLYFLTLETTAFLFCFSGLITRLDPQPLGEHWQWFIGAYCMSSIYAVGGRWLQKSWWVWFGVAAFLYTTTLLLFGLLYPISLLFYLLVMAGLFTLLAWYSEIILKRIRV